MLLGGSRFAPVQLDASRDLIRVRCPVAKRCIDLRPRESRLLNERRDGIGLACEILEPQRHLPYVWPSKQTCAPAGRTIAKRDEGVFLATCAFLGVTAQSIRERLPGGSSP